MSLGYYILDEQGCAVPEPDLLKWARWFDDANAKKRVLKQTRLGQLLVSTVFLGIDHAFSRDRAPVLWETMVFGEEHQPQWRFTCTKDALDHHDHVVEQLQRGVALQDLDPRG